MTDQTDEPPDAVGEGSRRSALTTTLLTLLIFGFVALAGAFLMSQKESGGVVELTPGGVKVSFNKGESLAVLLDRAMNEQPEEFGALLARHDFYSIQDAQWTNRLREIDVAEPVKDGVRQLLFDLKGPFALPTTFAKADQRLMDALAQLDADLEELKGSVPQQDNPAPATPSANAFLASLVRQHMNQSGVFKKRTLNASVHFVHFDVETKGAGEKYAYVCSASELLDSEVQLFLREEGRTSRMERFVVMSDPRVSCQDSTQTIANFLAYKPAQIWLPADSFNLLYGAVAEGGTPPPRFSAGFEVAPKNYRPVVAMNGGPSQ